jgi:SPP1 gp7 family putative phage head morphogenesis protein
MSEVFYGSFKDFIFKKAVNFLKNRKVLPKEEYQKLDDDARAKAFTVSGYTSLEILQQFSDSLTQAVEEGKTKDDFRKEINSFLEDHGYDAMNPWKSDTIFRTNIQTAYNAGHYKSMTSPETLRLLPYWQYKTAYDGRVRDEHAAMHNAVYRADDPIWDIWYPPNGFRCRCIVRALSRSQVDKMKLEVQTGAPRDVDYETGEIRMLTPDKGFSCNPAKSIYKPDMSNIDKPLRTIYEKRSRKQK